MNPGQLGAWSPFQIKLYRALWFANLGINLGSFTHITAAGWTMTLLTDSAVLVGAVQTVWAVPGFLLALHSGAIADEFDRRWVVAISQSFAIVFAVIIAFMQWNDLLTPGILLGATLAESIALTVGTPAMIAMTPQVVGSERLHQALALDSTTRYLAQALGPAIAGAVIAFVNIGAVYMLNAIALVWVVVLASSKRLPEAERGERSSVTKSIIDGVRFVMSRADLRNNLIRLLVASVVSASVIGLLPLMAKNNLGMDASGYGALYASVGVGAVIVVMMLPRVRRRLSEESLVQLSAVVWGASIAGAATTTSAALAMIFLGFAGAGLMAMMNVLFTSFLSRLEEWVRGRGSSISMFAAWLGASAGSISWGALAGGTTVTTALVSSAAAMVLTTWLGKATLPMFRAANS
jgi:MFS family permease